MKTITLLAGMVLGMAVFGIWYFLRAAPLHAAQDRALYACKLVQTSQADVLAKELPVIEAQLKRFSKKLR